MQIPPPTDENQTGFGADASVDDPNAAPFTEEDVGTEQATEKEQAQYDLIVSRAVNYIHGNGKDQVDKLLSAGNSPAETIGQATATIVKQIATSISDQEGKLGDGVLFHAGLEIVEVLTDYGMGTGKFSFTDDEEMEQQIQEAFLQAIRIYGEAGLKDGTIGDAEKQEAEKLMDQGVRSEESRGIKPTMRTDVRKQQMPQQQPEPPQQQEPAGPQGLVGRVAGGQ